MIALERHQHTDMTNFTGLTVQFYNEYHHEVVAPVTTPWEGCASIHKAVTNGNCLLQLLHVHMQACLYSSNTQAVIATEHLLSWNCRIKALYQQATWVIWIMHPQNYQLIFDHKPAIHCSTTGIPWDPHNATYMPQFCITNWKVNKRVQQIKRNKGITYSEDYSYVLKSEFVTN